MEHGDIVICVAAGDDDDELQSSVARLLAHTPHDIRIVICGPDNAVSSVRVEELTRDGRTPEHAENIDVVVSAAARADLVVVRPPCLVTEGWLDGLHFAAYADSRTATASASPVTRTSVGIDEAAVLARTRSLRIHPRLPAPLEQCTYVRRSALELVGEFGHGTEFSRRCEEAGLCHVLADEVLVEAATAGGNATGRDSTSPLARALSANRRALDGLSVVIDGRIPTGLMPGTRVHVLELIGAVARTGEACVHALVPPDLDDETRGALGRLPELTLTTVSPGDDRPVGVRADLVHRPFQVSGPADLAFLGRLGGRLAITHQDLISYHNRSYFRSESAWQGYRELTRRALSVADRVLFVSAYSRDDAISEGLVEEHRTSVVHLGVDHQLTGLDERSARPPQAGQLPDAAEMMLCIGTDLRHKNRKFALRMLQELQRRHDWEGYLVLAGPRLEIGGSSSEERQLLASQPRLARAVLDLGPVSEAAKTWLLRRAQLVVYPTVHEGFGLVPFESARVGVPCMWASGTSLAEVLPAEPGIVPWDAAASADRALELIRDEGSRARNVQAVREASRALTWDAAARRLLEVYETTCDEPATPCAVGERSSGIMRPGLSEDAVRLVGPDGLLPPELERPLLALATHPTVATPVFGAIKAGYRASRWWRLRGAGRDGV